MFRLTTMKTSKLIITDAVSQGKPSVTVCSPYKDQWIRKHFLSWCHHSQCQFNSGPVIYSVVLLERWQFFSHILTKDTSLLTCEDEVCGKFCELNLWLNFIPVAAVLYKIRCYIGPRYSSTWPYLFPFDMWWYINTLRANQKWLTFCNYFKFPFLDEIQFIMVQILLMCAFMGPIDRISSMIQLKACWIWPRIFISSMFRLTTMKTSTLLITDPMSGEPPG